MRILILTHSFNSLTQRLFVELSARGHDVTIEFDINDAVALEAVRLAQPDLVIAPFLKRAIPPAIWRERVCLVVHPGPEGDRGPAALDWAILEGAREWGVTVLQAEEEMDAGPVWASATFPMREATKSSLYRNEVADAAIEAVLRAVEKFPNGERHKPAQTYWKPAMTQQRRAIDWSRDDTATVLRKIRSADGNPGLLDSVLGEPMYLYDAHPAAGLSGEPGRVIARCDGAICRATVDGAVWIGHLRRKLGERPLKLPATMVLGDALRDVPECAGFNTIRYEERNGVGYLHFPFYNGAMSTAQCERLREAYVAATRRDTRVIALMGGPDFWSNGIHLNVIEAAESPADESWRNIVAMDDLCREIITTESQFTIAALHGNAGAGGVFLALAADRVVARDSVVLNPHYKGMGNLYGSEYWTYLLPRRAGSEKAHEVTQARLPVGVREARRLGLIDEHIGGSVTEFRRRVEEFAGQLAANPGFPALLAEKRRRRAADEAAKPLESYRQEELARLKLNFYGFDPSYHVARYNFVNKVPKSRTPLYLARHRGAVHKVAA
ncbi:MAG: hydrogenase maturation protein [Verrucomicrobia bacterium]|nr:hydrogenase maturation protein [Verrucomicrobiota bacterium]